MTQQESPGPERPAESPATGSQKVANPKNRRNLYITLTVTATVAVAIWASILDFSGVTRENYVRIEQGMTYEQVKAVLGPPRDFRMGSKIDGQATESVKWKKLEGLTDFPLTHRWEFWASDEHVIRVGFDESGAAVEKGFGRRDPNRPPSGLFSRIKEFWKQWFGGPDPAF